jgi:hypothetical protein
MRNTNSLFSLLAISAFALPVCADDLSHGVARMQWSHQGEADVEGGGTMKYDRLMLQTSFGKPQHVISGLHVIPTMRYTWTDLALPGTPINQFNALHQLELPLTMFRKFEGTPWTFNGNITPGLASDFEDINGDDFYVEARFGGDYKFSDTFTLNFGLAYTRVTGHPGVIPFVGFDWRPSDAWRASIFGPRIDVRYTLDDDLFLRFGGAPGGGLWNYQEETTGNSRFLNLVSYHVGLTIEKELSKNLWIYAGGGISLLNHVETRNSDNDTLYDQDADSSPFWQVGIRLGSW